jgi:tetratricopeptide (TPR) repeat protein
MLPDSPNNDVGSAFTTRWSRRDWLALTVLVITVFGLYFQTHRFDFIDFDDNTYVYGNPHVTGGMTLANFRAAMTQSVSNNWHPLTMLGMLTIASIFGPGAATFHITNALLHTVNTALLFVFLRNSTTRFFPAFFAAALWGLHPLRVESVAWVSEFKDVLCGCLWLLCMLSYLRYCLHRTALAYLPVMLFQSLALLAKPMAVTLPFALLLLDWWTLQGLAPSDQSQRNWWIFRLREKVPLLLLAVGASVMAMLTQKEAQQALKHVAMGLRIENAVVSVTWYLKDFFWPSRLAAFYPHPAMLGVGVHAATATAGAMLLLFITISVCWAAYRSAEAGTKDFRYLPMGWFWFLGTLVPVIGLLQVGEQARADRYTYLPSIGLTIAVVWLIADLVPRRAMRAVFCAGCLAVLALWVVSNEDLKYWQNTDTLFTRADEVVPDNYTARSILGYHALLEGHPDKAIALVTAAVKLAPQSSASLISYGAVMFNSGRLDEAEWAYAKALSRTDGCYGHGRVLDAKAGKFVQSGDGKAAASLRSQACEDFREAIAIDPENFPAQNALAQELARMQKLPDAIAVWRNLLVRAPAYGPAHGHLADALRLTGDPTGALAEYHAAIDLGERNPYWEMNLVYPLATDPRTSPDEVQKLVSIAVDARNQTRGQDPNALDNLAICLARVGQFDNAINAEQAAIDQANRLNKPASVKEFQARLDGYRNGIPFLKQSP